MTAQTPIKCFRYLAGAFYVEDYAGLVHLFATVNTEEAYHCVKNGLWEQHGRPVLNWGEDFSEPTDFEERPKDTVRRLAGQIVESDSRLDILREQVKIQAADGTWDYDPYMFGMYNGMEFALATMEGRRTNWRDAPEVWGYNKEPKTPQ